MTMTRTRYSNNILNNPVELPEEISEEVQDLLLRLLHKDPNKRLGHINGAKDIKKHPWFYKINWKDIERRRVNPPFPVSGFLMYAFI